MTPTELAERLAVVLTSHTDGKGLGLAYAPFHYDAPTTMPLPAALVRDLESLGLAFNPRVWDGSGWRRYVTADGRYTVLVEGWGDHCVGVRNCKVPRFEQELRKRLSMAGLSPLAIVWSPIPLMLDRDRWGYGMTPLKFRTVSLAVIDGSHPIDLEA